MTEPAEQTETQEPQEPATEHAEPVEPDTEPDTEPVEPFEPDEGGEDEQEAEQPTEPSGALTEKELEAIGKKLDRATVGFRTKLETILGEDLGGLVPCPTCMDGTPGYIFPPDLAPLTEAQRDRMLQILGLDEWNEMPTATWAVQCSTCLGYGKVKTGSHVGGRETAECEDCAGAGWNNTRRAAAVLPTVEPADPNLSGPLVHGIADPDPRVDSLRRDGFTVIPPPNFTAAA